ncbi:MAG: hypothetical protein HDR88_07820 [Bacteroides sp.]|nr:hypothetical protein [Bacteroides sp.]
MGKKEKYLESICNRIYKPGSHVRPTLALIKSSDKFDEVCKVYKALGGILDVPPVNPGKWDIDMESFIIELDEENHFNRYRLITLDAPLYQKYNNFDVKQYRKYCLAYEYKCPTSQKRWSNPSADKQFGESGPNGNFSGNGPSRWKQRAFYDYLKDIYSVITGIPIIRISIYDQAYHSTIKQLLDNEDAIKIKEYLQKRIRG